MKMNNDLSIAIVIEFYKKSVILSDSEEPILFLNKLVAVARQIS
jgi:hypothetical protein